jgi:hypothetical protein
MFFKYKNLIYLLIKFNYSRELIPKMFYFKNNKTQ